MASDLQSSPTRPVRQNHAANNAFGDLISPKTPSAVPSRIMQAKAPAIQALRVAQLKPRPSKARSFLGSL
jgi:hypothetical protein